MSIFGIVGWALIGAGAVLATVALRLKNTDPEPAHSPMYWPDFSGIVIPVEDTDD